MKSGNKITSYAVINILDMSEVFINNKASACDLGCRKALAKDKGFKPWMLRLRFGPYPFPCYAQPEDFNTDYIVKTFGSEKEAREYGLALSQEQPYQEYQYLLCQSMDSELQFNGVFAGMQSMWNNLHPNGCKVLSPYKVFADMQGVWNYLYSNECKVLFHYGIVGNDIICEMDIDQYRWKIIPTNAETCPAPENHN